MIQEFVDKFMAGKESLAGKFSQKHPDEYIDIVKAVVEVLTDDGYSAIDPDRIHQIDDGDYQGTLVFVIAAKGYQPDDYWTVKVGYGSCSGCDTLESIRDYSDDKPSKEQVDDYMTLALHIVQELRVMGGDAA